MDQIARPCTNYRKTALPGRFPMSCLLVAARSYQSRWYFGKQAAEKNEENSDSSVISMSTVNENERGRFPRLVPPGERPTELAGCHGSGDSPTMKLSEHFGNPSPIRIPGNLADPWALSSRTGLGKGRTPMQSRFSKWVASFLLENQKHSRALTAENVGIVMRSCLLLWSCPCPISC
jgi:hypothetical protein